MPETKTKNETGPAGAPRAGPAGAAATEPSAATGTPQRARAPRWRQTLSFRNISAIYIFIALFVLFSLWVPDTFLNGPTWRSLLDNQALTAMVAIGLVIPLAAGVF